MIVIILVIISVFGFVASRFLVKEKNGGAESNNGVSLPQTSTSTLLPGGGSSVPDVSVNPLEKLPEVSPTEKINPFEGIKTNPFE